MLLTLPSDEKDKIIADTVEQFESLSGEKIDPEKVAALLGISYGLMMDKASSRSPGCYFADLGDLKERLVEQIKLMEPEDGEEWHDETAHQISQRVAVFFDNEIFDKEQAK